MRVSEVNLLFICCLLGESDKSYLLGSPIGSEAGMFWSSFSWAYHWLFRILVSCLFMKVLNGWLVLKSIMMLEKC